MSEVWLLRLTYMLNLIMMWNIYRLTGNSFFSFRCCRLGGALGLPPFTLSSESLSVMGERADDICGVTVISECKFCVLVRVIYITVPYLYIQIY